jgi:YVTN family beta-propeller protein
LSGGIGGLAFSTASNRKLPNMKLTRFATVRFTTRVPASTKETRRSDDVEAKSALRSSVLALAIILSSVSTGLTQESVSSKFHTNTGLPINQLVTTISLGDVFPAALVVSPDGKTIYVASFTNGPGLVSIIDSQSNTVTDTISVGGILGSIAITPDGSALYLINDGSSTIPTSVVVISTTNKTVTATIQVSSPGDLAVSPSGKYVYVTDAVNKAISIIETATNTLQQDAINTRDFDENIAVSPDGKSAYVSTADNVITAIDLITEKKVANIRLETYNDLPVFLTFNPDGKKLYLNHRRVVTVVDTSSNRKIQKIAMPIVEGGRNNEAAQTAITPDGKFLYVPYPNADTIAMVDTSTNKAAGNQVSVSNVRAVAVSPTNPVAYAIGGVDSGTEEGTLSIIDISPD